jgi:hypothetical protein
MRDLSPDRQSSLTVVNLESRKEGRMGLNDQGKIEIAREYFMRADQGRPDILELFHEDAEVYFPEIRPWIRTELVS